MSPDSKGRDLFIVDNSVSGWTGLRYLEEWSSIARAFDIATGYFEIGSLLALDTSALSTLFCRVGNEADCNAMAQSLPGNRKLTEH
jgi:hypothetical protein